MIYLTRIRARKEMMKILVSIKNYRRKIINHEQKTQNILEATNKKIYPYILNDELLVK